MEPWSDAGPAEPASPRQTEVLEAAYADAYSDWAASADAVLWDAVAGDGTEAEA